MLGRNSSVNFSSPARYKVLVILFVEIAQCRCGCGVVEG